MIEVTLKFDDMTAAAAFFNAHGIEKTTTVLDSHNAKPEVVVEKPVAEKKSRSKKENARDESPAKPVDPVPETETGTNTQADGELKKEEEPKFTIDDVRNALSAYCGKNSFEEGTKLMRTFMKADGTPAARLTELQEKDYADFIAKAKV